MAIISMGITMPSFVYNPVQRRADSRATVAIFKEIFNLESVVVTILKAIVPAMLALVLQSAALAAGANRCGKSFHDIENRK